MSATKRTSTARPDGTPTSPTPSLPPPLYEDESVVLYQGDALDLLPALGRVDAVVTDPPYGETSLAWDRRVDGWLSLLPSDSLWCFGSMRLFMETYSKFVSAGWQFSQDVLGGEDVAVTWEKHNGSSFHADRFRRVHEHACHFYKGQWTEIYRDPQKTMDATKRTTRRKSRPAHTGHIEASVYASEDGGPRLTRSIIYVRSAHGSAVHPTQKPEGIVRPLIEYAVPPNGIVLDPFAGSGSTGIAARQSGRRAILIERDAVHAAAAAERLAQRELVEAI